MSFIEGLDFDNVKEFTSRPAGEYQLRVMECTVKESTKTGGKYISAKLEILNEPLAKDINHVMMLPTPQDDEKRKNSRMLAIQSFFKACGQEPGQVKNTDDLVGCTCWAILSEESDPEYGTQNRVRKFVVGR